MAAVDLAAPGAVQASHDGGQQFTRFVVCGNLFEVWCSAALLERRTRWSFAHQSKGS